MRCKKRTCSSCGVLWAGDTRTRLLANLIDGWGKDVALLTVTAPGQKALPYGDDGKVAESIAHAWNVGAPAQWSNMHRRLRRRLARSGRNPPLILGYVWAYQDRGVLHLHLALAASTPAERWAARGYVAALKAGMAEQWGFGFVDLREGRAGSRGLAAYLAKYVCKVGASGRPELAETVDHADVPKRPVYISARLTRGTRCTMRNLRLRRYYWRAETMRQPGTADCWYVEDLWSRGFTVKDGRLVRPARGP
jgi:hypothetical protein